MGCCWILWGLSSFASVCLRAGRQATGVVMMKHRSVKCDGSSRFFSVPACFTSLLCSANLDGCPWDIASSKKYCGSEQRPPHNDSVVDVSFFFIKSFALPKAGGLEKKKKKKPELLPNRRPSSALLLTFALICCRILASPWARVPTTSLSSSRFSVQDYECHKQKKRTTYYHAHAQSRGGEPQSWLSWRQARLRVCQNVTTWPRL